MKLTFLSYFYIRQIILKSLFLNNDQDNFFQKASVFYYIFYYIVAIKIYHNLLFFHNHFT